MNTDLHALGVPDALQHFPPTVAEVVSRLDRLHPATYARTRNALDGAVSGLSPYFTHGLVSLPQAAIRLARHHRLGYDDKLVFEFGWRAFFHHVWHHAGDGGDAILKAMKPVKLWSGRYSDTVPADVREGRSGVPAIDSAVRVLYATGYLHNHARMWLASYLVHIRKVHWRAGADWLYGHLLDGDLPSNHLSWQWVANQFSSKPYYFNAGNVAKFAPSSAWKAWASPKTAIDKPYEEIDAMARFRGDHGAEHGQHAAVAEPDCTAAPPEPLVAATVGAQRFSGTWPAPPAGSDPSLAVELVHPWALSERRHAGVRLGLVHLPAHTAWPWNGRRWQFVLQRMAEVCDTVFIGDATTLAGVLQGRPVFAQATRFPGYRQALAALTRDLRPAPRLFADPPMACGSFSRYYEAAQREQPDFQRLLVP